MKYCIIILFTYYVYLEITKIVHEIVIWYLFLIIPLNMTATRKC